MMTRRPILVFLYMGSHCIWQAHTKLVNRTIDDSAGDSVTGALPTYLPTTPGVWADQTCAGCRVQADKNLAFDGTWTAATFRNGTPDAGTGPISIELDFTGTAVYVNFILANLVVATYITTETACNFTLDGVAVGSFEHQPTSSTDFQYNATVFSAENLPNMQHHLIISTAGLDRHVFTMFDYAIYTVDIPDITSSNPSPATSPGGPSSSSMQPGSASSSASSGSVQPGAVSGGTSSSSAQPGSALGGATSSSGSAQPALVSGSTSSSTTQPALVSDSPSPSSAKPKSVSVGAVVGVVGGVIILLLLAALAFLLCRRRKQGRTAASEKDLTNRGPSSEPSSQGNDDLATMDGSSQSTSIMNENTTTIPVFRKVRLAQQHRGHWETPVPPIPVQTAPPVRATRSADSDSSTRETLRRGRQAEIDYQLRELLREMRELNGDRKVDSDGTVSAFETGASSSAPAQLEVEEMRRQMEVMRAQIEDLRTQQDSDWAQGLSDDPPPGYTPRAPSIRIHI